MLVVIRSVCALRLMVQPQTQSLLVQIPVTPQTLEDTYPLLQLTMLARDIFLEISTVL